MSFASKKILDFALLIGKLKSTRRTGWVRRNVQDPESVADHMYRMSILAFLLDSDSGLNKVRCIKIALVHDMAECIVGDLTPSDNVSKEEKHRQEKAAMVHIQGLVSSDVGEELFNLWKEYEDQCSSEAKFVKDLDKFDMILQAYEYETAESKPGNLQEFFDSTKDKFQNPTVQQWVEELYRTRQASSSSVNTKNQDSSKGE